MKPNCILILVVVILQVCFPYPCLSQEIYTKGYYSLIRSHYSHDLVSGFDMNGMKQINLQGFNDDGGYYPSYLWYSVRYSFRNEKNVRLNISIGVYPTITEAEDVILDSLNDATGMSKEGKIHGIEFSDNLWYRSVYFGDADSVLTGISFIRKNIVIHMSSPPSPRDWYYSDILTLAEKIDNDLLNGSAYVTLSNNVAPPVIHSINLSSKTLKAGEMAAGTIEATNPSGGSLIYRVMCTGLERRDDSSNVFTINSQYISPPVSVIPIKAWVVNEKNVFSSLYETQINF